MNKALPAVTPSRPLQENFDSLNSRLGSVESKSHGLVTSLPANPTLGATCVFKAALGIHWELVYTAEATYPWAKIGGPPLFSLGEDQSWGDTATHATTASITAPLAMEFQGDFGCFHVQNQTGNLTANETYLYVNGVNTRTNSVVTRDLFEQKTLMTPIVPATVAAGQVINVRVRNVQANNCDYRSPLLRVDPLRVG